VQSATWQAPDGRIGLLLANYADLPQHPRIELEGQGTKKLALYLDGRQRERDVHVPSVIDFEIQPRGLALIEVK
jgi:hypothetical protein